MAILAVVMWGVISAGGYLIYQEFFEAWTAKPAGVGKRGLLWGGFRKLCSAGGSERPTAGGGQQQNQPAGYLCPDLQEYEGIPVDSQLLIQLKSMVRAAAAENVTLQVEQGYVAEEALQKNFDDTVSRLVSEGEARQKRKLEAPENYSARRKKRSGAPAFDSICQPWRRGFSIPTPTSGSATTVWITALSSAIPKIKRKSPELRRAQPQVFRFVGVENAKKMRALAFCVEEYADYIRSKRQAINPVRFAGSSGAPRRPAGRLYQANVCAAVVFF